MLVCDFYIYSLCSENMQKSKIGFSSM